MSWQEAKDVILGALSLGIGGFLISELKELRHSIEDLNTRLATILERTSNHEKALFSHAERLNKLEVKGKGASR